MSRRFFPLAVFVLLAGLLGCAAPPQVSCCGSRNSAVSAGGRDMAVQQYSFFSAPFR